MNRRIFLCGITSAELSNIKDMVEPVKDLVDGLIFVCDEKALDDGTEEYLLKNKKDGRIIFRPWTNDFDIQFSEILRRGGALHNVDWMILRDSSERVNPDFLKELRNGLIDELIRNNITCVFQRSKPAFWQFSNSLIFRENPHVGLFGIFGKVIDLSQFNEYKNDEKWLFSLRKGDESWVKNGLKYTLWPRSNHMLLVWGERHRFPNLTDKEFETQYRQHEEARLWFLDYWFRKFGCEPTVDSVTEYMKNPPEKWDYNLFRYFNFEVVTRNHYRWKILNEKIEDIMNNQWDWHFSFLK